jgi:mRNA-degrading endonuclease YafQ of YafQ-DinJ toxin-antitoxin module
VKKGPAPATIDNDFTAVLTALISDYPLEDCHRDHPLTGEWKDHRDCHIKPDLVLIYSNLTTRPCGLYASDRTLNSFYDCLLPTVFIPVISPPK